MALDKITKKWRRGNVIAFQIDRNRSLIVIVVTRSMCGESLVFSLVMWVVLSEMRFLLTSQFIIRGEKKTILLLLLLLFEFDEFGSVFCFCFSFQGKKQGTKRKRDFSWRHNFSRRTNESRALASPSPTPFQALVDAIPSMSFEGVDVWPSSSFFPLHRTSSVCPRKK